MKYHLLVQGVSGPLPCGPREAENPPEIGSHITETIESRQLRLEVVGHQHLPVVPGGTFAHDEVWVLCRQLGIRQGYVRSRAGLPATQVPEP